LTHLKTVIRRVNRYIFFRELPFSCEGGKNYLLKQAFESCTDTVYRGRLQRLFGVMEQSNYYFMRLLWWHISKQRWHHEAWLSSSGLFKTGI